jgi:dTDP-glucose 4,6-dehydratase
VLVTGAGGFIGSHLAERLVELGARTRAFVRYNSTGSWGWLDSSPVCRDIEVIRGDIRDAQCVRLATRGVDVVFHLAALIGIPYSYEAPQSYVRTNLEGTLNVLEAALEGSVSRVVHTSTSEVYGTARFTPINEDHPLQAQSPYSASKIGADKLAESFYLSYRLPVTTVRPFNTFGPRQSTRAVIPTIITQALQSRSVRLGRLSPTRDFSYVADTVEGFLQIASAENSIGKVVNLGSGREISIGDLARLIFKLLGDGGEVLEEAVRLRPENSEVERLVSDTSRAAQAGWRPGHTLENGLLLTIDWIRSNLENYRVVSYAT